MTNICDGQSTKVHKQYTDVRGRSKILKGLEQRSLHKHSVWIIQDQIASLSECDNSKERCSAIPTCMI